MNEAMNWSSSSQPSPPIIQGGILIGLSKHNYLSMRKGNGNAMIARARSFMQGFQEVLPKGMTTMIVKVEGSEYVRLVELSRKFSHIFLLEWGSHFKHFVCDANMRKALSKFAYLSMHTIEPHWRLDIPNATSLETPIEEVCEHKQIYRDQYLDMRAFRES